MMRAHETRDGERGRAALSREARAVAEEPWRLYWQHPFFGAIADGSLSFGQLRFWLEHDTPYVRDFEFVRRRIAASVGLDSRYAEFHSAIAKAGWVDVPGEDEAGLEDELLLAMGAERRILSRLDPGLARQRYMNHIVRAGYEGSVAEMIAALLPCEWGFVEIAERLSAERAPGLNSVFERWIEYYTMPIQRPNLELTLALFDRAGELADQADRERATWIFLRSAQHQVAVLDAAWLASDAWPDEEQRESRPLAGDARPAAPTTSLASFADEVRASAADAWRIYVEHPFFAAIADGSITFEQLRFWLEQDLPYLADYEFVRERIVARVQADRAFAALAPSIATPDWVDVAGKAEVGFEQELLEMIGAGQQVIRRFDARPAREGYMNHIVRAGYEGTLGEMVAALLPCEWGFTEMAARLEIDRVDDLHPALDRWIAYYTSDEQRQNTDASVALLERVGELAAVEERERIKKTFLLSVRHQIAVLDAAWKTLDPWPEEQPIGVEEG
jgi:thiaminase/transcriptional activator TenA